MIELVHLKAKVSKLESQLAAADASSKHTKIEHDSQILSLEQQLQVQPAVADGLRYCDAK